LKSEEMEGSGGAEGGRKGSKGPFSSLHLPSSDSLLLSHPPLSSTPLSLVLLPGGRRVHHPSSLRPWGRQRGGGLGQMTKGRAKEREAGQRWDGAEDGDGGRDEGRGRATSMGPNERRGGGTSAVCWSLYYPHPIPVSSPYPPPFVSRLSTPIPPLTTYSTSARLLAPPCRLAIFPSHSPMIPAPPYPLFCWRKRGMGRSELEGRGGARGRAKRRLGKGVDTKKARSGHDKGKRVACAQHETESVACAQHETESASLSCWAHQTGLMGGRGEDGG
jgi:hypothetical protein